MSDDRKPRAPNLDGRRLKEVVDIIRAMKDRPTWNGVIQALHLKSGIAYTRQALASHPSIKAAYQKRRNGELTTLIVGHRSAAEQRREGIVGRLRGQVIQLERDLEAATERMACWAVNAFRLGGLDEASLDQPLTPKRESADLAESRRRMRNWRKRKH